MGRRVVYGLMWGADRIMGRFNPVVILCYHSNAHDEWRYSIDPEDFKAQIMALKGEGYVFISLTDLEQYLENGKPIPEKSAILNFDDGYRDVLSLRDFIREEKLQPTMFVLSDPARANQGELGSSRELLSWEEIRSLAEEGWIIGSHSATHADMCSLDPERCQEEVMGSKAEIERQTGREVRYFAYPKGAYTERVLAAMRRSKYTLALSMDDGIIGADASRFALPRIGVDRTHTLADFRTLYSPSVVWARGVVKRWLGWSGVREVSR